MHSLDWDENDTPISKRFGDPYFSRQDGRLETHHIFLAGNGLPDRWRGRPVFTIGELGFGTGLNFLETLACWQNLGSSGPRLRYIAYERFPLDPRDLRRALARWPELGPSAGALADGWPPETGRSVREIGGAILELYVGDANVWLPKSTDQVDAWYLDGFSPAKNPDLWGQELMLSLFERTSPGGTFATFTVAGWVRRNLTAAGFRIEKMPGFGRKREFLRGQRPEGRDSTAAPNL